MGFTRHVVFPGSSALYARERLWGPGFAQVEKDELSLRTSIISLTP